MKKPTSIFFILILLLFFSSNELYSQVAEPVSITGHVTAEIIPVFAASETSQLNFGRFSPGPQGGRIILTPENTVSVQGSIYKGAGTVNAASFYVSGDADAAVSIGLPDGPVILNHSSSARTLLVTDWISSPVPGSGAEILDNGSLMVYVGATLVVGTLEDNPVGIYTGTYNITFDFN